MTKAAYIRMYCSGNYAGKFFKGTLLLWCLNCMQICCKRVQTCCHPLSPFWDQHFVFDVFTFPCLPGSFKLQFPVCRRKAVIFGIGTLCWCVEQKRKFVFCDFVRHLKCCTSGRRRKDLDMHMPSWHVKQVSQCAVWKRAWIIMCPRCLWQSFCHNLVTVV